MTFFDISKKMLLVNFQRYKLYFLCNVFSIVLFYCFAAIFTNEIFMNPRVVDPMTSNNIYAPSIFVGFFIVLFIPYSYNAFMKNRKYEYGVFTALGMSEKEVLLNMLIENSLIAGISLVTGLVLGTFISFLFYFIIQHMIGVTELKWYFNFDSYVYTSVLYGATMLVTLVCGILSFIKMQLTDLIKEKFRAEKKKKSLPGFFIAGIILVFASIFIMGYRSDIKEKLFLISSIIMFIGLYMVIANLDSVEKFLVKIFPGYMQRHILEHSFIRQHDNSRRRISIIAGFLIAFSTFFGGMSVVTYPSLIDNAMMYSPYDMVYSNIFGKNQVEDSAIKSLLYQNGVSIKSVKQAEYLRDKSFNLLPVSEVNKEFNCGYQVPQGKFLMVYQYYLKDGYDHELMPLYKINYQCLNEELELNSIGKDIRILFNDNPTFSDYTLIINDEDYSKIASECRHVWKATMKLYNFDNWKESEKGIAAVQNYLLEKNHIERLEQKHYYRASSRVETYITGIQSGKFFIFLMSFIFVLFYGAANIMIHFKIKSESEKEQRVLSGLYRLGVTEKELLGMIRHKNISYYLPQIIIGTFIGTFYNYMVNDSGYGLNAVVCCLFLGIVLTAIQLVGVMRYSRRELVSFGI